MNYGRNGVKEKQKRLNALPSKWGRKAGISTVKLALIALIGLVICGIALGIGIFTGILVQTPRVRLDDIIASGEATVVYDRYGVEIDQYHSSDSNRIIIPGEEMSPYIGKAFVACEDERFYQHNGIDYQGLLRAGYQFIVTRGKEKQGASTITQQLLKNTIFTSWTEEGDNLVKMIKRKIQEQYLAIEVSKQFSKEDVLTRYMNVINLGGGTYGVESASLRYFGKHCSELTISECATIAAITQNPSANNPIRYPEKNLRRRNTCLLKMLELEFITQAQYDEAIADSEDVYNRIGLHNIEYNEANSSHGSYFSDAVYNQVKADLIALGYSTENAEYLLNSGGLKIYSTMDSDIQAIADEEYANPENFPPNTEWYLNYALTIYDAEGKAHNFSKENMMKYFKDTSDANFNLLFKTEEAAQKAIDTYRTYALKYLNVEDKEDNYRETISLVPQPQSACAIEDQRTGEVVAMVGGVGSREGRRTLNRAISSTRSPGSVFKVLASFLPALDADGQTLATVYEDAPFNYNDGTPVNNWYHGYYLGIQNIREAIVQSLNIIAVKTVTCVGPEISYEYLNDLGFTSITNGTVIGGKVYTDVTQTIALGGLTNGVSPYEVNAAYATIANNGQHCAPKIYTLVTDRNGNILLDNRQVVTNRVMKETTAFLLTDAMTGVVTAPAGTARLCNFNSQMGIAGKTGSTTSYHDVWFAGFTPYYTCTVWTGYDNNVTLAVTNTSQMLWKSIMSRVHENLEPKKFEYIPDGIIECAICTRSGKLPIEGLCDALGCVKNEYFTEYTVPTEYCDRHYQGRICAYDGMPATEHCPFAYEGYMEVPYIVPPELVRGSTLIVEYEDGTQDITPPRTSYYCSHTDEFMAQENAWDIIDQQQNEMYWRNHDREWWEEDDEED